MYFVGRTCGGPAKVRYDGQGMFTDLTNGRVFVADIRKATTHDRKNTYFALPGTPIE